MALYEECAALILNILVEKQRGFLEVFIYQLYFVNICEEIDFNKEMQFCKEKRIDFEFVFGGDECYSWLLRMCSFITGLFTKMILQRRLFRSYSVFFLKCSLQSQLVSFFIIFIPLKRDTLGGNKILTFNCYI